MHKIRGSPDSLILNHYWRIVMEISMQDGRVYGTIGGTSFPLTTLPLGEWREGEDVVDHRSLRLWEADCARNMREGE